MVVHNSGSAQRAAHTADQARALGGKMIPELHENILPYISRYTSLKKVSAHEWAGSCPVCGGHDRFKVNDQRGWFCRHCTGSEKWGDLADFTKLVFGWSLHETLSRFNLDRRATAEEIAVAEERRKAIDEEARKAEAEKQAVIHTQLTQSPDWRIYHDNLDKYPSSRQAWHERGLSDDWIEYYRLGYSPSRRFNNGDSYFESASLTIPYFRPVYTPNDEGGDDVTWQVIQLKHRLLSDNTPGGKYRPHLSGAGNHLFFTDLFQRSIFGDLLIVEGEIKAIVTWAALWIGLECLAPNMTIIGIPGQGWRSEWVEQFNQANRVFICLDPDAQTSAMRLMGMIRKPAKNILLPDKIDDLINIGVLDGEKLLELCNGT